MSLRVLTNEQMVNIRPIAATREARAKITKDLQAKVLFGQNNYFEEVSLAQFSKALSSVLLPLNGKENGARFPAFTGELSTNNGNGEEISFTKVSYSTRIP